MPVSRRKFLQNGAFAAAALAVAPLPAWSSGLPGANSSHTTTSLNHASGTVSFFNRQAFEQAIGSSFQVSSGAPNSQPVYLRLLAVDDLPALVPVNAGLMAVPPPQSKQVSTAGFILSFQTSAPQMKQGSYTFQHPTLGQFQLFIVPGTPGMYAAVFNLLNGTTSPVPPRPRPPVGARPEGTVGGNSVDTNSGAATGSGSTGSSGVRPAQETLEPVLGRHLEIKLPE